MDRAPGRIGFMSTQRRENRSIPATKNCRRGLRYRWRHLICTERAAPSRDCILGTIARQDCADDNGGTAPSGFPAFHPSGEDLPLGAPAFHPSGEDLPLGAPAWLATNSLLSDSRIVPLVLLVGLVQLGQLLLHHCSPPFGLSFGVETSTSATYGSSIPHIPSSSGLARLHPALP
jgi:hypothetical protein